MTPGEEYTIANIPMTFYYYTSEGKEVFYHVQYYGEKEITVYYIR